MKLFRLFTVTAAAVALAIDSVGSGQGRRRTEGAACDDGARKPAVSDPRPESWRIDRVG